MIYANSMLNNVVTQEELHVKQITDRILSSGKMSRQDHELLTKTVLTGEITDGKRRQINRIFDQIQTGQLRLVNW